MLTTSELESLRHHLGYGNVGIGGEPYTEDGFQNLFAAVIAPYLTTGTETSATTAITAGSIVVVTPLVMTDIVANVELVIDNGEDAEIVMVKAVTLTTFTARFVKAHAATGYPVSVMCGKARLRLLLWDANALWRKLTGKDITQSAGIKQLGNGEIEWFAPNAVLRSVQMQYLSVIARISSLVRVTPIGGFGGSSQLESY